MKWIKVVRNVALLCLYMLLCMVTQTNAQLVNNGGAITITSGAVVYANDSIINTANGTITNGGALVSGGKIFNNSGSVFSGGGTYSVQGNFTNNGTYNVDTSKLNFFGSGISSVKNKGGTIYILQVNKDLNGTVNLQDNEKVLSKVRFLSDKNWIKINDKILTLSANCTVENASDKRYFITNGTGFLKKLNVNNTPFVFPVGFNGSTYNKLIITENGTADAYAVRCTENALLNGSTGAPISTNGINAGWVVQESVAGGANAVIQGEWKTTDELPGFDYTHCMFTKYTGGSWDYKTAQAGTATGISYRDISRSGLSSFGYFTVLSSGNPAFASGFSNTTKMAAADAHGGNLEWKIYPTLVQNSFTIAVPRGNNAIQKMDIIVADAGGKTVWQKPNAAFASQQVILPVLAPGLYTVLIQFGSGKFVQKIIVER